MAIVACMETWLVTGSSMPAPDTESPLLVEALTARGIRAQILPWDAEADWSCADLVVVRSTWDYFGRRAEFLAWAEAVHAVTRLVNPLPVLRWNTHKSYLLELARGGVPVVPTRLVPSGAHVPEPDWWAEVGPEVVVKPAVSVGAIGVLRGRADSPELRAHLGQIIAAGDALVQPFLPSVSEAGETSLIFAGETLSHAVRKIPRDGDYRVQEHHGGTVRPHPPTAAELRVARAALALAPARCAYARVDLVETVTGPVVMELELVEPFLFLTEDPDAVGRFASAFLTELGR